MYDRVTVRQKLAAFAIVAAIGGIVVAVLYAPGTFGPPEPAAISLPVPRPIEAAPAGEVPAPVAVISRALPKDAALVTRGTPQVAVAAEPDLPAVEIFPALEEQPMAATPLVTSASLPVAGEPITMTPHAAPHQGHGALRVAGQSVGAAFSVAGRGLATAFKRAF